MKLEIDYMGKENLEKLKKKILEEIKKKEPRRGSLFVMSFGFVNFGPALKSENRIRG